MVLLFLDGGNQSRNMLQLLKIQQANLRMIDQYLIFMVENLPMVVIQHHRIKQD